MSLPDQLLHRFGGRSVSDPHKHTFCLECSIPAEAINQDAKIVSFRLGKCHRSRRFVLIKISNE